MKRSDSQNLDFFKKYLCICSSLSLCNITCIWKAAAEDNAVLFSELAGGETDSVVESLTDTDSVRGLGETRDFLNMVRDQ